MSCLLSSESARQNEKWALSGTPAKWRAHRGRMSKLYSTVSRLAEQTSPFLVFWVSLPKMWSDATDRERLLPVRFGPIAATTAAATASRSCPDCVHPN